MVANCIAIGAGKGGVLQAVEAVHDRVEVVEQPVEHGNHPPEEVGVPLTGPRFQTAPDALHDPAGDRPSSVKGEGAVPATVRKQPSARRRSGP